MTGLLAAVRFLHLASLATLVGAFAFLVLVLRPAAAGTVEPLLERLDRRLLRLAGWSLAVALATALLWLGLEAAVASGRPLREALAGDALGQVLARTQFGRVWLLRVALMVLLAGFLLLRERERDARDWIGLRLQGLALAAAIVAALAWTGHAAAGQGLWGLVHLAADAVHLVATGLWLGGLIPLAWLLAAARHAEPWGPAVAARATRRFSLLGLVAVSSLVATGLVNGWFLVGDVPGLVGTPYGRLLLLKLALLLPLVAVAAANRTRLLPGLAALGDAPGAARSQPLLRRLMRNVVTEAGLGAAILLVVGGLGVTPPGQHQEPTWPFSFRLSWEAMKDVPGVRPSLVLGGAVSLAGLGLVASTWLRRFRPRWALGLGLAAAGWGAWLGLSALAVDAYPTTYARPAVPYQAASIARGAALYGTNCAVCHGPSGRGDGPAARGLAKPPADLTARHTADHTAGDMFWWLTHGIPRSPMPGFGDRLTPFQRWDLINFVRALGAAEQATAMTPRATSTLWLAAPDFSFGPGVGPEETLKEHRGWAMVHLVLFTLPGSLRRLDAIDRAWGQLGLGGARVIAVPMDGAEDIYRRLGLHALNFPIAVDGAEEIVAAYVLYARSRGGGGPLPAQHLEFLIDRQGYLRARWIPGEEPGWREIPTLLAEVRRLDREAPRAPPPEEHVH